MISELEYPELYFKYKKHSERFQEVEILVYKDREKNRGKMR